MYKFTIQTQKSKEIIDITQRIQNIVNKQGNGVVSLHLTHTTAALTTADLDPGTDQDMLEAFYKIVPAHGGEIEYRHPHNPEHTPDHILSAIIGTSVSVPVEEGKLLLGQWQNIVLCEFDGPRERGIVVSFAQTS